MASINLLRKHYHFMWQVEHVMRVSPRLPSAGSRGAVNVLEEGVEALKL